MGKKKHFINLIFTITLLGVFALAAILVAVMGAQVYSHSADNMQANFDTRTSLVYMSEKIRQTSKGQFEVGTVDGNDALVLGEEISGEIYEAWIYVADGELYEVTVQQGTEVEPGDGQKIMDLKSLSIEEGDNLITLEVVNTQDRKDSITVSRRGAGA